MIRTLLAVIFIASLAEVHGDCTTYDYEGSQYLFSPLSGASYSTTESTNGNTIYFSYCDAIVVPSPCTNSPQSGAVAYQLVKGTSTCYALGLPGSEPPNFIYQPPLNGGDVGLVYFNPAKDPNCGSNNRAIKYLLACDWAVQGAPQVISVTESDCVVVVTVSSKWGCAGAKQDGKTTPPASSGISGGWVFIIVLLSSATLYLVVGSIINWKVRGKSPGRDMIPQIEIWSEVPGLVWDGCRFTKESIVDSINRRRGYASI